MAKPAKIAKILSNSKITDDMVIQVGDESFSVGDLRALDAETEGASTSELETRQRELEEREGVLAAAQNNTIELLNGVAEHLGVSLDDLVGGKYKGKVKKPATQTQGGDDPELEGMDDTTRAAVLAARKIYQPSIDALKKELADTRKALGVGISVSLDQYYEDTWDKLSDKVPTGDDGKPLVKLDMKQVLKYATDNKLNDARGRLDMRKAFNELTAEARLQKQIQEAEARGVEKGRSMAVAASMQKPGQNRPSHLTQPPVVTENGRTRTKTLDEQLEAARQDTEIWQSALSGGAFGSA